MAINYQNPIHLAKLIEEKLSVDRPKALVQWTSNPGSDDEHYIALVLRVYSDASNLNTDKARIAFRANEVRYRKANAYLPELSSVEILTKDFKHKGAGWKIHFSPKKVAAEDPALYAKCQTIIGQLIIATEAEKQKILANLIGEECFEKTYNLILSAIDHN